MPLRTESAHKSIIFGNQNWFISDTLSTYQVCISVPGFHLFHSKTWDSDEIRLFFQEDLKERRKWRRAVTSVRLLLHLGLQLVAVYQLGLVLVLPESESMLIQGDKARIRQSGQSQGYFSSTSITFQFQFQGSLKVPKIDFFIKLIFEVWFFL